MSILLIVIVALVETLGSLGHRLGVLGHALGTPWPPFGLPWAPFGRPWPRLGHPLGTLGHCRGDIWTPRGNTLAPFGHTSEATSAILETCLQKGQQNHFFGLPLGTLLGTSAYIIRTRLRSPNTLFPEAPGSQKGGKMRAKMMSQDTKNHKSREKRTLEKTSKTKHYQKWVSACLWGGRRLLFSGVFSQKNPKNLPLGPQASRMSPRASKMTENGRILAPRASKMTVRASKMTARASKMIEICYLCW